MKNKLAMLALIFIMGCAAGKSVQQKSLYVRLGSLKGIHAIVAKSIQRIAKDSRINEYFVNFDIGVLQEHFIQFFCIYSGGPCKYEGESMPDAHKGLHITNAAFDAVLEDFGFTMRQLKLGSPERDQVLQLMNSFRKDIVEEK